MLPIRKPLRLNPSCYAYPSPPCSITIAVKDRLTVFGFDHDILTRMAMEIVSDIATTNTVKVHIVLFMPDHVHLCAEASPAMTLTDFVKAIKSRIAVEALRYGHAMSFWQRSFFDHFVRKDEQLGIVIRYILNNPCRKQLVQYWWEYPYWYSNQYKMEQLKNTE